MYGLRYWTTGIRIFKNWGENYRDFIYRLLVFRWRFTCKISHLQCISLCDTLIFGLANWSNDQYLFFLHREGGAKGHSTNKESIRTLSKVFVSGLILFLRWQPIKIQQRFLSPYLFSCLFIVCTILDYHEILCLCPLSSFFLFLPLSCCAPIHSYTHMPFYLSLTIFMCCIKVGWTTKSGFGLNFRCRIQMHD